MRKSIVSGLLAVATVVCSGAAFLAVGSSTAGAAVTVEPSPSESDGSVVTLTHSGVPPRPSGDAYWVRDLLMLSLANLASYCEGRRVAPRCDETPDIDLSQLPHKSPPNSSVLVRTVTHSISATQHDCIALDAVPPPRPSGGESCGLMTA